MIPQAAVIQKASGIPLTYEMPAIELTHGMMGWNAEYQFGHDDSDVVFP